MTIDELNKQTEYDATEYVNDSAPDIDAEHLNKNEQKLKETVQQANNIIDTLKALISDVQTESSSTVPSSSLVYQMQQQIDSISQGGVSGDYIKKSDISNVQVNDQNKVPSSALAYSMQQQINETNSNLEWKLNGTYKATDTCPLPEKYNELMIKIYRTSDNAYTCGVNILKAELGKNTGNWMTGCGRDASGWDVKIVIAITNTIAISSVFINAADNKSNFSFAVYYR